MGAVLPDERTIEFLLAFDGRIHHFGWGYWVKFEIKRTPPTPERPHGLRYALTLHDPDSSRLVGFDNAHGVPAQGSRYRRPGIEHDHWHRSAGDAGRPYRFVSADQLLVDFEREVARVLAEHGISDAVIGESRVAERGSS